MAFRIRRDITDEFCNDVWGYAFRPLPCTARHTLRPGADIFVSSFTKHLTLMTVPDFRGESHDGVREALAKYLPVLISRRCFNTLRTITTMRCALLKQEEPACDGGDWLHARARTAHSGYVISPQA